MNQSTGVPRYPHGRPRRAIAALVVALLLIAGGLSAPQAAEAAVAFVTPTNGNVGDTVFGCPAQSRPTHQGVDINQNAGATVYAAAAGTVVTAVNSNAVTGYGTQIVIAHAEGYTTRYAHMVYGSVTLAPGAAVPQGAVLGVVGSTGASTGPHLHFEIYIGSTNVTNSYFLCGQGRVTALSPLSPRRFPVNADVSGDGISDLVAISSSGQMYVYTGDGRGGWGMVPLGMGWEATRALIRGDFNGDGRGDIMAVRHDGTLWFYRNAGGYAFYPAQVGSGWGNIRLVTGGADYNDDGRADLIAVGADDRLYMYTGNGAGGFTSAVVVGSAWGVMDNILAGDFSGDGRGDLLARDRAGNLYSYRGNGYGVNNASQVGSGWHGMTVIAGGADFTSDGNADVLARDASGNLWLYPWTGAAFGAQYLVGHGWNMHRLIH